MCTSHTFEKLYLILDELQEPKSPYKVLVGTTHKEILRGCQKTYPNSPNLKFIRNKLP